MWNAISSCLHSKMFEPIMEVCAAHDKHPKRRDAQKLLAAKVTEIVHGKEGLDQAVRASEFLFGK